MGLVDEGRSYVDAMTRYYNVEPNIKNYVRMVDLLARSGLLKEAEKLIDSMPIAPDVVTWGALLGACRKHGNSEMGERVGRKLLELQPDHDGFHPPGTDEVLLDIDKEKEESTLFRHSEKLAITYGLISMAPSPPIRIIKNLKTYSDCHAAAKLLTKAFNREIVVRDQHQFHHFKDGSFSCVEF
ncbi:hypothetical protein H5410_023869 [Solanum commersonii]|uniref:DYW domain-containing protein n=1 Tax=Solanum commersonii TaxID=4109 RepID=A0A9J5ZKD7_SOLCO|nr:hypothetical protein H5410_023869 [Solanum commersonii]